MGFWVKSWGVLTRTWLKLTCGIDYQIKGIEHIPSDKAVIFASQHQSSWETICLFHMISPYPAYVLKADMNKIPFWKLLQKSAGMLPIKRSDGAKALKKMIEEAHFYVAQKRSIVIFPEGTRVAPDQRRKFQPGIYALAKEFPELPIIPVTLNSGIYWPKFGKKNHKGTITMKLLPAIDIKDFSTKQDFLRHLEDTIYDAYKKLS